MCQYFGFPWSSLIIDWEFLASTIHGYLTQAISPLQNRDDVRVLLMPISQGANGLNLVEASHVILTEPLLNPAQELQAIGRVHRIGQKKQTFVHRLVEWKH